jgi:hypothetical protein
MSRAHRSDAEQAQLAEMVEEATIDAYNEAEQVTGLCTMLDEHLDVPFETQVLGVTVIVRRVDVTAHSDDIVAVCDRDGVRQNIPILDLPLPSSPPGGFEWIAAYRHWRGPS